MKLLPARQSIHRLPHSIRRPSLQNFMRQGLIALAAVALTLPWPSFVLPVAAQTAPPSASLHVAAIEGGTRIEWNGAFAAAGGVSAASLENLRSQLPEQRYQGYDLPMQVIALRAPGPESAQVQILSVQSVELPDGVVQPGATAVPPVLLEEGQELQAPATRTELPGGPVFVLRAGRVDGYTLVVVGLSPIFRENGVTRLATQVTAYVPGATQIDGPAWQVDPLDVPEAGSSGPAAAQVESTQGAVSEAVAAVDAVAPVIKIAVTQPGIQRLLRSQLAELAPAWSGISFNLALLTFQSNPHAPEPVVIPLQRVGSTELRFYVDKVGDRWNSASYFLLSAAATMDEASPAMEMRTVVAPGSAGDPSMVWDVGEVRLRAPDYTTEQNSAGKTICRLVAGGQIVNCPFYNSNTAGSDGDHYFVANLVRRLDHSNAISVTNTFTMPVTIAAAQPANMLPAATGAGVYTVTFSSDGAEKESQPNYQLQIGLINENTRTNQIVDVPNPDYLTAHNPLYARATAPGPVQTVTVTVLKRAWKSTMLVEAISYARRVMLDLGNHGAKVTGLEGSTEYRWANAPAGLSLYDVTDPTKPVLLGGHTTAGFVDSEPGRTYLIGGAGFVSLPALALHRPLNFDALAPADAVYIIPSADYRAALQPLLTHRAAQTCPFPAARCKVLSVEAGLIYDRYSGGHVSPEAIRAFLQEAFFDSDWRATVLDSVVFVGDGTYDPKNLEKKGKNLNLIPPYLHEKIDPWIGETACDRCYGQLDGEDPHTGDELAGRIFYAEIWTGRFPINSPQELAVVVNKILAYEKAAPRPSADSRILYLADNYRTGIRNGRVVVDRAGNFVALSEAARDYNPSAKWFPTMAPRIYYDPLPAYEVYSSPPAGEDVPLAYPGDYPWHIASAGLANQLVRQTISAGLGLVVYNGHANTFQQGRTEEPVPNDALVQMNDSASLAYGSPYYVQLSMTCRSAQFIVPTNGGTVLDEAYFVREGKGSIAAWGPTGLSVVHGHDALQKGFFESLFQGPRNQYLGRLMEDGYLQVMLSTSDVEDVLRTFVFFGDPLTRIRYTSGAQNFLPTVDGKP